MVNKSFLGLGSNIDDRFEFIEKAIEKLEQSKCEVVNVSSIYETKPYGYTKQNNFLNCVVEISTSLDLNDLFEITKQIEQKLGRKKRDKWGPREIDLDILFFNDVVYSDEKLTVPHKDVVNRDFVLIPLCEIAAEFVHPEEGRRICDISINKSGKTIIRKLDHQFS